MKTIEKMILCCIWICIAIVAVLIKDQMDLNQKIEAAKSVSEIVKRVIEEEDSYQVLLDEDEVMMMVAERMPVMSDAQIRFQADGVIEVSVVMDDALIQEAQTLIDHELLSSLLPLMKGTSIGCSANLSAQSIELIDCHAGLISIPDELLNVVEETLNETWGSIVRNQKIESAQISEGELQLRVLSE